MRNAANIVASLVKRIIFVTSLILRILLWPVARAARILFPSSEYDGVTNARALDGAARDFSSQFQKRYLSPSSSSSSSQQPISPSNVGGGGSSGQGVDGNDGVTGESPFETRGYKKCITDCGRQSKCLLVYLHSPLHRDTDSFCRGVLGHSSMRRYLSASSDVLSAWGGSIHAADGANVAGMLGVAKYPFVALLACQQGRSSVEILLKMEGATGVDELVARLTLSLQRHRAILEEREMRRLQREEEVRLRQEQDREYQETLAADRRREEEARLAARLAEEEERAREEEERRRVEERERELEEARRILPEEPAASAPKGTTTRIRFTLPSGTRVDRRFRSSDTIHVVRAFLVLHFEEKGIRIANFSISTNYPKRVFDIVGDKQLTLEEAGLIPQAVIMIQDLDA